MTNSLMLCWSPIVSLGVFDGKVAAVVICTTPNQDRIWLPTVHRREVYLRADFRYGPDDPTLWPQPWVIKYPHLAAVPRKPDNRNDPLSIMWWDPTRDDFRSLDSSLADGLGDLSRSKFFTLEAMMKSLEGRIEEHKKTSMPPNSLLLLLARVMHDGCVCLGSLKTTFTEMRFGVADFQCNYLEICSLLDYLELYKLWMDGQKPPATIIANCVGVFTNVPEIVQCFHTAGLLVWFLWECKFWTVPNPITCNILEVVTPLNPADILCVSHHDPPFSPILRGFQTNYKKQDAIHIHSQLRLVLKDPFQGESG